MKNEILEALTIIEEEHNRTKRDIEIIKQAKQEIERLNNIIKEVREYIDKEHKLLYLDKPGYTYTTMGCDILQILNKGESND